jgi:hypothetical protein
MPSVTLSTHGGHHRLVLLTVERFGDAVAVKWPVDGDRRYLRHRGEPSAEHELSVGPLVAAATVAHEHERERTVMFRGSPQDARHDT